MAWRKLEGGNNVHGRVGSTDFKIWEASVLNDFTLEDIQRADKRAEDWTGFMGLGDFRGLCRKERKHASYSQFLKLPIKPMAGTETQRRIRALKVELAL